MLSYCINSPPESLHGSVDLFTLLLCMAQIFCEVLPSSKTLFNRLHSSADQLSKFRCDSKGIDHFVKGKNEKYGNVKEKSQEKYDCQDIKINVQQAVKEFNIDFQGILSGELVTRCNLLIQRYVSHVYS